MIHCYVPTGCAVDACISYELFELLLEKRKSLFLWEVSDTAICGGPCFLCTHSPQTTKCWHRLWQVGKLSTSLCYDLTQFISQFDFFCLDTNRRADLFLLLGLSSPTWTCFLQILYWKNKLWRPPNVLWVHCVSVYWWSIFMSSTISCVFTCPYIDFGVFALLMLFGDIRTYRKKSYLNI